MRKAPCEITNGTFIWDIIASVYPVFAQLNPMNKRDAIKIFWEGISKIPFERAFSISGNAQRFYKDA